MVTRCSDAVNQVLKRTPDMIRKPRMNSDKWKRNGRKYSINAGIYMLFRMFATK